MPNYEKVNYSTFGRGHCNQLNWPALAPWPPPVTIIMAGRQNAVGAANTIGIATTTAIVDGTVTGIGDTDMITAAAITRIVTPQLLPGSQALLCAAIIGLSNQNSRAPNGDRLIYDPN